MPYNPNMRVLVVDDFSTMRRIVRNILRQLGFQNVVEADDGTSAWEVLNREKIDFIVSDWNMPQMTGIELLRKVRSSEQFAAIPFLMVTAEASMSTSPFFNAANRLSQGWCLYSTLKWPTSAIAFIKSTSKP